MNTCAESHIPRVLITGGIAAGKSIVSRIVRLKGYDVFDTDLAARDIMNTDPEVIDAMSTRWGDGVFGTDGKINRRYISQLIFSNEEERLWLNSLVHRRVREAFCHLADSRKGSGKPMFVECALPSTSRIAEDCDVIWLVETDHDTRLSRLAARNPEIGHDEALSRIESQKEEFSSLPADRIFIIDNSDEAKVLERVDLLLAELGHKGL